LYDYRALPYLILQIYIEELLSNIGRTKNSEYRIDPPPTVIEKFNHHINLKRQCLAYIPFLCWLIDFDVLVDTAFACEPCLRSCLLHDAAVLQATLIYADQELNHLNQSLHFQLCFHHPHPYPPPPKPPTPKPSTPKPPTPKPSTPKPSAPHPPQPHNTCCTHCPQPPHPTHPTHHHLLPIILIFLLLLLILSSTLTLINSISQTRTLKYLFYLSIPAILCHLLIRHYIHSSLHTIRDRISVYVADAKKAIIAVLVLVTAFLQC
jgi:hypothetical protein